MKASPITVIVQLNIKNANKPAPDCSILKNASKGGSTFLKCINVLATQKKIQHESIKMILLKATAGSCIYQNWSLTSGSKMSDNRKGWDSKIAVLVRLMNCWIVIEREV